MKIKCPWIVKERAQRKREMRAPQILEREQAQRYAAFLLARDGVTAEPEKIEVAFSATRINGRNVKRAWQYRFAGTVYDFPHREFVAAAPVYDEMHEAA